MVHRKSHAAGKLVGLSNASNRPDVDNLDDIHAHIFASIVDQRLSLGSLLFVLLFCVVFFVGCWLFGLVLFWL